MDALARDPLAGGREHRVSVLVDRLTVPVVAALLVVILDITNWRGGDWPAQVYRAELFERVGLTLWNTQWYSGHWTLTYSTLFPVVASWIGLYPIAMLSVVTATWAFDRLALTYFGQRARVASYSFVATLLAAVVIGQLTFLLGLAFGMLATLAVHRLHWWLAVPLALCTALSSPLAAAFLVMATVAAGWAWWPRWRVQCALVVVAAAGPVALFGMLFPRQGPFPFYWGNLTVMLATCAGLLLVLPRRERGLRRLVWLYALALVVCFVPQTPVGANVDRFGRYLALPLLVCVAWPARRRLLLVGALPLLLLAWMPAVRAVTVDRSDPSAAEEFYDPLLTYLTAQEGREARVEVVPTRLHWEVAYVAPTHSLARGWERQVDIADNPLFYDDGLLTAQSYVAWLHDNGVRWVALPEAPLDYAGVDEAELIRLGVPGLEQVWRTSDWTVYEVTDADGIVSGPAELVTLENEDIHLLATGAGTVIVRVHAAAQWELLEGRACLAHVPDARWLLLKVRAAGPIHLQLDATDSDEGDCESESASGPGKTS